MGYIYALRKNEERDSINLEEYESEIKASLKYLDVQKENYIIVNKDSFEFSYSGCILYGHLRRMGRILSELGYNSQIGDK